MDGGGEGNIPLLVHLGIIITKKRNATGRVSNGVIND